MKKPKNLTDKEWAFVLQYPIDWNATRAAKDAGYSEKSASVIGYENLRKPHIKKALNEAYAEMSMSVEEMWARIADIAKDLDADDGDKLRAMQMIGRGYAAFVDKVVQDTNLDIKISFEDGEG